MLSTDEARQKRDTGVRWNNVKYIDYTARDASVIADSDSLYWFSIAHLNDQRDNRQWPCSGFSGSRATTSSTVIGITTISGVATFSAHQQH